MSISVRRIRGILLALGILTLSATVVFAGQPAGKAASGAAGRAIAAQHSGTTVPTARDEGTDTDTDTETDTAKDPASDGNTCAIDLTQDVSALSAYSHGEIVCSAAHAATPDGYANHGAWVRHWATWGTGGADAGSAADSHKASGLSHKP